MPPWAPPWRKLRSSWTGNWCRQWSFARKVPREEFRTLRTRLEQLQSTRAIQYRSGDQSVAAGGEIVHRRQSCSGGSATGRQSHAAVRFRPAQAHAAQPVSDRPRPRNQRSICSGKADLHEALRRIGNSNLFVMPAGEAVINPLGLLHSEGRPAAHGPFAEHVSPDSSG